MRGACVRWRVGAGASGAVLSPQARLRAGSFNTNKLQFRAPSHARFAAVSPLAASCLQRHKGLCAFTWPWALAQAILMSRNHPKVLREADNRRVHSLDTAFANACNQHALTRIWTGRGPVRRGGPLPALLSVVRALTGPGAGRYISGNLASKAWQEFADDGLRLTGERRGCLADGAAFQGGRRPQPHPPDPGVGPLPAGAGAVASREQRKGCRARLRGQREGRWGMWVGQRGGVSGKIRARDGKDDEGEEFGDGDDEGRSLERVP